MTVQPAEETARHHATTVDRAPAWAALRERLLEEAGRYVAIAGQNAPTSVHIMSEARIRERIALWRETSDSPRLGVELSEYNAPELLQILADEPVNFHADSLAHLEMLEAVRDRTGNSLSPERIILNSPFNDDETMQKAAQLRVGAVAISSLDGLEALIAAKGSTSWSPRIDLRLAVHEDGDPHLDPSEIDALVDRARAAGFIRFGLSIDLQDLDYRDLDEYRKGCQRLTEAAGSLQSKGETVETVMLGGGFCSENLAARSKVSQSAQAHLADVIGIVRSSLDGTGLPSVQLEAAGSRFIMGDKVLLSEINGATDGKIHIAASGYGVLNGVLYRNDPVMMESFPFTTDTVMKEVTFGSCDSADSAKTLYAISRTASHGDRVAIFPNGREHTCAVPFNGMYDAHLVILRADGSFQGSVYNTLPDAEMAATKQFTEENLPRLTKLFDKVREKARAATQLPDPEDEAKLYAELVSSVYEQKPGWEARAVHYLEYIATYAERIVKELGIRHEDLHFAIKAFPSPMVLMLLKHLGCSFDSASMRERLEALYSGHEFKNEVNSNPRRDKWTLQSIAKHPGAMTTVDSIEEIDRLLEYGLDPKSTALGVRVAIKIAQGTGNLNKKFGASLDDAEAIIKYAIDKGFTKETIYFAGHPGTQKTSGDDYALLGDAFLELAGRFAESSDERYRFLAKTFDFGGGLPSQEIAQRANNTQGGKKSLLEVLKEVGTAFKSCRAKYAERFGVSEETLIQKIEPGRSIVQGAWVGIRVLSVREVKGRRIVVTNCSTRGQVLSGAVHDDDGFRIRALLKPSGGADQDTPVPSAVFGCDGALDRVPNERRASHAHYLPESLTRGGLVMVWGGNYSSRASAPIRGRGHGKDAFCYRRSSKPDRPDESKGSHVRILEEVTYNGITPRVRLSKQHFESQQLPS